VCKISRSFIHEYIQRCKSIWLQYGYGSVPLNIGSVQWLTLINCIVCDIKLGSGQQGPSSQQIKLLLSDRIAALSSSKKEICNFQLSTAVDGRKRSQSRTVFDFDSISVRRRAVSGAVLTLNTKCMLSTLGASQLTARSAAHRAAIRC